MRRKRKGTDIDASRKVSDDLASTSESKSTNNRSHYSLEDYERLRKKSKEDSATQYSGFGKTRVNGIATAPPSGTSFLVLPGRGIKRKIGCIDIAIQTGMTNKVEEDYVKDVEIGKGKFGSVWSCRSTATGSEFACKTLRKGEETVHREVEIMQHLSGHPGVVTLHAVYEDPECFHLIMELCSRGRLIDHIADQDVRFSEQRAASIFKDVMMVIKYCHEMGVVHRDIKPENILLTAAGKIKLADFGLAVRITNGQTLSGLAGSPAYVAPEVLSGNYSEKVDVWSAGILLHVLLVSRLPFQGESMDAIFEAIKTLKLDFHSGIWESVSKPARDLMARMLTRDVSARISADEVLRHPWILFYTDRACKILSIKSKSKNQAGGNLPRQELTGNGQITRAEIDRRLLSANNSSCDSEEQDESGVMDLLANAISRVRISEPKRSRICSPTNSPIEQQHSTKVASNNLCRAF